MGLNPEALVEVVGGYLPKAPPPAVELKLVTADGPKRGPGSKVDALRAALQPEAMAELITADGPERGRK
jgi:hypothetical protein